ncbi:MULTISPECIES: DUF427 domain-containing protein [Acidiphilium]|uniref:Uncharacterized conserved protein, DUF427 family n=1 Tax=Acidiphilium rubrum TaxID=526 RepID=A0A8G2CJA3_ACIRU|nr:MULTISPECIES: DUF427 domain-containing protein [Acidiphilium]SIQ47559.1 Uncharacterized conserved protein, DUF427 family [Acidiphilium rubrum]
MPVIENVWDYPRPPRLEPVPLPLRIDFNGTTIAATTEGFRVLETSHPPVYYLPRTAFSCGIEPRSGGSFCEWKGRASYWSLRQGDRIAVDAAWSYPTPSPSFLPIRDYLAVYAGRVDACFVGDEQVTPQPGGFYGGWVTANLIGPFKGSPGTMGW